MVGPDLSGAVLDGRYRLVSLLGAGGMGQIYEGTHLSLDRRVAVKVLPGQLSEDPRFRARFAREARAAAKITHRNVVQIMDFGESPEGLVYFVMEFLEGRDVGALLREVGRLPWPRARHLLLQATSAIKASHAHGIIHRDIKPGNCFVVDLPLEGLSDVVKLLDFGIAKVLTEAEKEGVTLLKPLTVTGEIMGTASYMSPEQARGERMDARSDVYSLGIMAYEMLTGRVPFVGSNIAQVVARLLFDRPEPLHRAVPDVHPEVEAIVLRAIAKDPEERFQSMAELEVALAAVQEVGIESVPTRVLSAVGSVGQAATGRDATAGAKSGSPTVVLRDPETQAEPRGTEDSFEDAETPDPFVLMPRFGEPYPVRPRGSEEPEPAAVDVEGDPVGGGVVELEDPEEVTSARIRLVSDSRPGRTDVAVPAQDLVVEVVQVASTSVEAGSSASEPVAAAAVEPSVVWVEAPPVAREATSRSSEAPVPRRARSRGWALLLGAVLLLGGGAAAVAGIALSGSGAERDVEASARIAELEPVERTPAAIPLDEKEPEEVPEPGAARAEPMPPPARAGSVQQATAEVPAEPMDATAEVDDPVAHDVEAEQPAGLVETTAARPSKQKPHETKACEQHRERAYLANDHSDYRQVIKLAAPGPCWPSRLRLSRLRMQQTAFLETKQFAKCVEVGRGSTDSEVMRAVKICEKQLQ